MTDSAFLHSLTDFGSTAVLIPVSVALAVWLLFQPSRRLALWWLAAAAVCIGGTAVLKVVFFVCPPDPSLQSPSGHTSLSTFVYGALAMLLAAHGQGWLRKASVVAGILVVLAIAVSRVLLGAHTVIETALGLAVGLAALAIFFGAYSARQPSFVHVRPLFLGVALLIVLLHGQQLQAEELLRAFGFYMKASGAACI